jgi:hypothetical protein
MMKREVRCESCGWTNRVPFYLTRRIPLCGNKIYHAVLPEPSLILGLRSLNQFINYVNKSAGLKLSLSLIMIAVGYYAILGKHKANDFFETVGGILAISGIVLGLQEVVWAFLATSERWEHACEHLEPQIFLVA